MTNITHQRNLESRFIQFLNQIIHDRTMVFPRTKKEDAVNETLLKANAFYAKVLLDACLGIEPTLSQFENSGFEEGDDAVFQGAVYLYYKWKKLDHREVTRMYCEYLNRLMQKAGLAKTSVMDRAVTSINGRQGEILAAIKEMTQSHA